MKYLVPRAALIKHACKFWEIPVHAYIYLYLCICMPDLLMRVYVLKMAWSVAGGFSLG